MKPIFGSKSGGDLGESNSRPLAVSDECEQGLLHSWHPITQSKHHTPRPKSRTQTATRRKHKYKCLIPIGGPLGNCSTNYKPERTGINRIHTHHHHSIEHYCMDVLMRGAPCRRSPARCKEGARSKLHVDGTKINAALLSIHSGFQILVGCSAVLSF